MEVLKNFYLGWSLHDRLLLTKKLSKGDYPPMVIPGYGKGNKGNVFDVQYTVSYLIPMWKVKQKMSLPRWFKFIGIPGCWSAGDFFGEM